jgi:hypothetical protein
MSAKRGAAAKAKVDGASPSTTPRAAQSALSGKRRTLLVEGAGILPCFTLYGKYVLRAKLSAARANQRGLGAD